MTTLNLRLCDNPECKTRSEHLSPETHTLADRTVGALLNREASTPGFIQEVFRVLLREHPATTLAPTSGRRTSWVPGILKPPHVPEDLLQPRDYWFCSDECFEARQPHRDEHERLVHDRYEGKPHVPALDAETLRMADLRIKVVQRVHPEYAPHQVEALALQLMHVPDSDVQLAAEAAL